MECEITNVINNDIGIVIDIMVVSFYPIQGLKVC